MRLLKNFLCAGIALISFNLYADDASALVGATDARSANIKAFLAADTKDVVCKVSAKDFVREYRPAETTSANAQKVFSFEAFDLAPNQSYKFEVLQNGKPLTSGSFKTAPDYLGRFPVPDFSFVVVGNQYTNDKRFDPPFRENGGNYEIFETISKNHPAFVIWAGDFETLRLADTSKSSLLQRRLDALKNKKLAEFVATNSNYGVLAKSAFAHSNEDSLSANAKDSHLAFDAIWANPSYQLDSTKVYSFKYCDAQFFILDACSNSVSLDYKSDYPQVLGKAQMRWLMNALQNSNAKFKVVVLNAPVANPVNAKGNLKFTKERDELFAFLDNKKIGGVIFLTSGKDYGEVTKAVRAGAYPIYDATIPPLTGRPAKETDELNYFREPNSGVFSRGFARIAIEGKEDDRTLTLAFVLPDGTRAFSLKLPEKELYTFD